MPDWTLPVSGEWTDAAQWTGGVPNGSGTVANFNSTNPASVSALIAIGSSSAPTQTVTVGTINLTSQPNFAWSILGGIGATAPTLTMAAPGGGFAQINVDTNGSTNNTRITNTRGLRMQLLSDTIINTINSDTTFEVSATVFGAGEVQKYGDGLLLLSGSNSFTGGLRIRSGTVALTNPNSAGTGPVTMTLGSLRFDLPMTFANDIEFARAASSVTGNIAAATGTTTTLTGALLNRIGSNFTAGFGLPGSGGTIVLAASSIDTAPNSGWTIRAGTVRFGNAFNAANAFGDPDVAFVTIGTGTTIDTGGFASVIRGVNFNGTGTLRASSGTLDARLIINNALLFQEGAIVGTGGVDRLTFDIVSNNDVVYLSSFVFSSWNDGTDSITVNGSALDDRIVGTTQADTINGGAGNDYLTGSGGADVLVGGLGNDTYGIEVAGPVTLIEQPNEGIDTVEIGTTNPLTVFSLGSNFENLAFLGSANGQQGFGNTLDNVITAPGAAPILVGREGNDTLVATTTGAAGELIGGAGDDVYRVSIRGHSIVEFANEGTDRIETTTNAFELPNNVENLTGLGSTPFLGIGNALDNLIVGTTAGDELFGRDGNDTLDGGTGAANTLFGQLGDDRYFVRVAGDTVIEAANQGTDTVTLLAGSFTLPANVENLTSIGAGKIIVGNALGNQLSGNNGDDQINGLDGNDILIGFGGADLLQGGAGADQFRYLGGETGIDRIIDFVSGTDKIALDAVGFAPIGSVAFVAGAGAAANSANSTILYDTSTGIVSFDRDGNGAAAAVQLCQLNLGQSVVAGDFIFI